MDLIDQHISTYLSLFKSEEDNCFQEIFAKIQSDVKDKHQLLLQYIHLLLDEIFSEEKSETQTLHLHFDYEFNDDSLIVIAQYLLIRFFKPSSKVKTISQNSERLELLKTNLHSKLRKLSTSCPPEASGRDGGNKSFKDWKKEIKRLQILIEFYDQLSYDVEISANTLFNCQVRVSEYLSNIFSSRPYACRIEEYDKRPSFNILNTRLTLNQIDEIDNSIIDNLETIILFDCERKKLMRYFSLQDIKESDINLEKYLIVTFGSKKYSVQNLRDKINSIQSRFKNTRTDSYTIIRSEINHYLGEIPKKEIPVTFIGINTSHFWDTFVIDTNIHDLYELRSIRMMNLYSLCFNEEIKKYILEEIFAEKHTSNLISDETKQKLLDLGQDDLSTVKESLGNVLDLIISANLKHFILDKIKSETVFIVDDFIVDSKKLTRLISSSLLLTEENKLLSWSDLKKVGNKEIMILSYQDQGRYPYYFYPNLIETTIARNIDVVALFHKFLFSARYRWARYNASKEIYNIINHPFRQKYFQWSRLGDTIKNLRPQKEDDTNWDLEQQYSRNSERETIKLRLKNERERTFNKSELFIYSTDNSSFKVEKIGDIIEEIEEDDKYFVHQLDEIQERINLYEKMVDTKKLEEELNVIRQKFQIDNTETGRLWKILLRKRGLLSDEETLYDELKEYLQKKELKIVSLNHFKSNWLNPESNSIAPLNKRVFVELCEFLGIPKVYFTLIQRLKNASKQASRQSTLQMNRLLQDLFNDGCFDDGTNLTKIIAAKLESYKRKHPLDELGIDERHLGENLIALVELIKPEFTLKEIIKFKKAE
ncbi:MAG: hypothetical protein BGO34_08355 [Bacteroidia bacterium 44-10]|nr:MAG: hypothetical protein BGO34_08355 [Bacteroidia bacterium 44-10]